MVSVGQEAESYDSPHPENLAAHKAITKEPEFTIKKGKPSGPISAPFGIFKPSQNIPTQAITAQELYGVENETLALDLALHRIHSSVEWNNCYEGTKKPSLKKALRAFIQMQTVNACLRGRYFLEDGAPVNLDKKRLFQAASGTKRYDSNYEYHLSDKHVRFEEPAEVMVVDGDCLEAALWLQQERKLNPVLLNMASASNPGGGYRRGSAAQEENLHRRTNLFQCLEDPYRDLNGVRQWSYPLPEFGGLYTPSTSVLRRGEADGYKFLDRPRRLSIISAACYRDPPVETTSTGETRISSSKLIKGFKRKIECIFEIALENKHDSIILSAWGCGAYGCPPKHMAQIFKEVIQPSYAHLFKSIVFAIYNDQNAFKSHNPNGNVAPFAAVFGKEPIKELATPIDTASADEGEPGDAISLV